MGDPVIGTEAVAAGFATPYQLRSRYWPVYPGIYVPKDTQPTAALRAKAAWLWSDRRAVLAGRSASALHRSRWLDPRAPAELIHDNRRPPCGIKTWLDRFEDDEITVVDGDTRDDAGAHGGGPGLPVPARYRRDADRRARQRTRLKMADVELLVDRYRGRRGIKNARHVLDLVDGGAESPRETWLRLEVIRGGFPRPQTQIPVHDEYGVLVGVFDMGWEDAMVGLDYEGDQHRTDRRRFNRDIHKSEDVRRLGWTHIRVTAQDGEADILKRIEAAGVPRGPRV